jgi:hypothetical protein
MVGDEGDITWTLGMIITWDKTVKFANNENGSCLQTTWFHRSVVHCFWKLHGTTINTKWKHGYYGFCHVWKLYNPVKLSQRLELLLMLSCVTSIIQYISPLYNSFSLQPIVYRVSRNESGRFGALKSDSTHYFFRNACTKSGSLRFSQFSGCWLILSVYIIMSFDFPIVRLFGVR